MAATSQQVLPELLTPLVVPGSGQVWEVEKERLECLQVNLKGANWECCWGLELEESEQTVVVGVVAVLEQQLGRCCYSVKRKETSFELSS